MRTRNLLAIAITVVAGLQASSVMAADAAPVEPAIGLWKYDEFDASTNTCKSDAVTGNGDGSFMLSKNADGSIQIHPGDGSDAFKCTLTGNAFDCPERGGISEDLRSTGVDAKLTGKVVAKGTFEDAKSMKGQQIATFTCEGSACMIAAMALKTTFPCTVTIDFEAEMKSAK